MNFIYAFQQLKDSKAIRIEHDLVFLLKLKQSSPHMLVLFYFHITKTKIPLTIYLFITYTL